MNFLLSFIEEEINKLLRRKNVSNLYLSPGKYTIVKKQLTKVFELS